MKAEPIRLMFEKFAHSPGNGFDLTPVVIDGEFQSYQDHTTDTVWIGYEQAALDLEKYVADKLGPLVPAAYEDGDMFEKARSYIANLESALADRDSKISAMHATGISTPFTLTETAAAIVAHYRKCEAERGKPYFEFYKHPATGNQEENSLTIPIRLLNNLRLAMSVSEHVAMESRHKAERVERRLEESKRLFDEILDNPEIHYGDAIRAFLDELSKD